MGLGFDQLIPEFGHLLQDFSGSVDLFLKSRRAVAEACDTPTTTTAQWLLAKSSIRSVDPKPGTAGPAARFPPCRPAGSPQEARMGRQGAERRRPREFNTLSTSAPPALCGKIERPKRHSQAGK